MSTYSTTVLADSPIRYYRLDETSGTSAADSGSQNHAGTYTGTVTLNQTGLLIGDADACIKLDGSTGYVSVPTTSLPTGASAWTMECWVKTPSSLPSGFPAFMMFGANSSNTGAYIYFSSTGSTISLSDFASSIITGPAASTSTIYHVVGTYDGSTATLYVNGSSAGSASASLNLASTLAAIGSDTITGDYWNNFIDEAAWYSAALSSTRVLAHYNAGINAGVHRIICDGYGGMFS